MDLGIGVFPSRDRDIVDGNAGILLFKTVQQLLHGQGGGGIIYAGLPYGKGHGTTGGVCGVARSIPVEAEDLCGLGAGGGALGREGVIRHTVQESVMDRPIHCR